MIVSLDDGRTISVPLAWYPRLLAGTEEERMNFEFIGDGDTKVFIICYFGRNPICDMKYEKLLGFLVLGTFSFSNTRMMIFPTVCLVRNGNDRILNRFLTLIRNYCNFVVRPVLSRR